jgi:hypothetical protein
MGSGLFATKARHSVIAVACLLLPVGAATAPPAAAHGTPAQHGTKGASKTPPAHAIGETEPLPEPVRARPSELDCAHVNLRRINETAVPSEFAEVTKPIEFSVHETNPVVSFGAGRGIEADYILLQATRPIPEGILSKNFEIDTREPMKRIGTSSLESVHLRAPFYTRPHFFNHRREIGFNLCVPGAGADPGTYTGQFVFVGPGKIVSAVITQTAQLKATHSMFWIIAGGVLLAMLIALITKTFLEHSGALWKGPFWWSLLLVVPLVIASLLAMLLAYTEAPTWGENLAFAISALIATAFTAAGLGNTLTAAGSALRTASGPRGSNPSGSGQQASPQKAQPDTAEALDEEKDD